jgi:hypothetical protein
LQESSSLPTTSLEAVSASNVISSISLPSPPHFSWTVDYSLVISTVQRPERELDRQTTTASNDRTPVISSFIAWRRRRCRSRSSRTCPLRDPILEEASRSGLSKVRRHGDRYDVDDGFRGHVSHSPSRLLKRRYVGRKRLRRFALSLAFYRSAIVRLEDRL